MVTLRTRRHDSLCATCMFDSLFRFKPLEAEVDFEVKRDVTGRTKFQ